MSHPTPPAFDSGKNQAQNGAEVQFWHDYIQGTVFQKAVLEFNHYVMNSRLKLLYWVCGPEKLLARADFCEKDQILELLFEKLGFKAKSISTMTRATKAV